MRITRDRVLFAAGTAIAVVPGAAVPGVPWWVVACAAVGAFLTTLVHFPSVMTPPCPPEKKES